MKKTFAVSTAILGACIVAPFAGKASLPPQKTNDPAFKSTSRLKSTVTDDNRAVYVITHGTSTGSLIPTVYRIYRGRVTASSSRSSATYADLSLAGSESVAGALTRLDPSITTSLHR